MFEKVCHLIFFYKCDMIGITKILLLCSIKKIDWCPSIILYILSLLSFTRSKKICATLQLLRTKEWNLWMDQTLKIWWNMYTVLRAGCFFHDHKLRSCKLGMRNPRHWRLGVGRCSIISCPKLGEQYVRHDFNVAPV